MTKFKFNFKTDVDQCEDGYMVFLPCGWRWDDDIVHVRGFDTLAEIRAAVKTDVVPCICRECAPAAEPFFAAANLKGA